MPKEITIEEAGAYFWNMNKEIRKGAAQALFLAGQRGVQKIISQIIPSREPVPVDRGVYRAGWRVRPVINSHMPSVWIENVEAHAIFIEEGVRAENVKIGRQLIEALSEWAMRKGIADDEDEAVGIAFGIANKMKERGIFNRFAEGNGLHILGELMDMHISQILELELVRMTKKVIKNAR